MTTYEIAERILAELDNQSKDAHAAAGYDVQGWDSGLRLIDPAAELDDHDRELVGEAGNAAAVLVWQGQAVATIHQGATDEEIRRVLREQMHMEPQE